MKASKIKHKEEIRIKVDFPYNQGIASELNKIPDARWSQTNKAWHIPYSKGAFEQLKNLFPEIANPDSLFDDKPVAGKEKNEVNTGQSHPSYQKTNTISIEVLGRRIFLKLPKNEVDTRFILGLRYSRWDGKQFCW